MVLHYLILVQELVVTRHQVIVGMLISLIYLLTLVVIHVVDIQSSLVNIIIMIHIS